MTRYELVDGVLVVLGQNSQDRKFLPQDVEYIADKVISSLLYQYKQKYGIGDLTEFSFDTIAPILTDTVRGLKYIDYQSLPQTANPYFILSVSKTQGERKPFIWTKAGSQSIYDGLEASNLKDGVIWQENSKIYFDNLSWGVEEVLVKVIPSIYALSETDRVPIPFEMQQTLIQTIMNTLLQGERAEDKTNDTRQSIA